MPQISAHLRKGATDQKKCENTIVYLPDIVSCISDNFYKGNIANFSAKNK